MVQELSYAYILDGVDIVDYVLKGTKISQKRVTQDGNTASLIIHSDVTTVKTPAVGQSIVITRVVDGATKYEFRGKVKSIATDNQSYKIECKDALNELKFLLFTKSYDINIDVQAGEYSAIFNDIVTQGGFSASVVDSGTGSSDITATKFNSNRKSRLNRLNLISTILDWYFYHDYENDWIRLQPKGYVTNPNNLVFGSSENNIYNIPVWEQNLESMRNKITVWGATKFDTRIESETGDNTTTEFSFTATPVSTTLTVDGTLQVQGVRGSNETFDYYVDAENLTYVFTTAPTLGQVISMTYVAKVPNPVTVSDQTSIDTYGVIQEEDYSFKDIVTTEDADTRAAQILSLLKDGTLQTTVITDLYTTNVGETIGFINSENSDRNGSYIVYEKTINYPDPIDTVKIGSEQFDVQDLFDTIQERLNALESENDLLVTLLRTIKQFYKTFTFDKISTTKTKYTICDSFIVGHYINGVIGIATSLDWFESSNSSNWSGTSIAVSDEASIKLVGSGSLKGAWTGGATTALLTSTQSFGDLSAFSGASSGTAVKGCIGVWLYTDTPTEITAMNLKIGSGVSDYHSITGVAYSSVHGYNNWDNQIFTTQSGWNYILFKLLDASETGTTDWTAIDYAQFSFTMTNNTIFYLDYFTISKSNYIGANGVGSRKMVIT